MAINRSRGSHAAQNNVDGIASNGSDWVATVVLTDENGAQLTDVDADTWQMQIRENDTDTSALVTFSTADGTLTVTEGASETTLAIDVPQATIADLDGDYVIDVVSKAASGSRLTHRAHGNLTVRNAPIEF